MDFIWNNSKNTKNHKKHGVWFEEASTVFADVHALEIFDDVHSDASEDRYILIGMATSLNLLVVIYCESKDSVIRIISARKATRWEANEYEKKV